MKDAAGAIAGSLLGTAVGDALGLPYEGLAKERGIRLLGPPDRHRFLFGRGMVSDDGEHACMTLQALCRSPSDSDEFARRLAWRLRWWLIGLPVGMGAATLRATLKLWIGFPPSRSGVFSAGNGPAMRAPVLGAAVDDLGLLWRFVAGSTSLTHSDPKATHGAQAVAFAAWCAKRGMHEPPAFFNTFRAECGDRSSPEFDALLAQIKASVMAGEPTAAFAAAIGCPHRVTGYIYHTVPVALHAWLSHPRDFRAAVRTVIECGGDADTTAAVVGGIVGAGVGREGIPADWLAGLWEWPRTVGWMTRLAEAAGRAAADGRPAAPPGVVPGVGLVRNAIFLGTILCHIARRALPPY